MTDSGNGSLRRHLVDYLESIVKWVVAAGITATAILVWNINERTVRMEYGFNNHIASHPDTLLRSDLNELDSRVRDLEIDHAIRARTQDLQ